MDGISGANLGASLGASAGTQNAAPATKDTPGAGTKFQDVWQQVQSKYGGKPEKQREIKKSLGKDDFLNIMIQQMKYQDPTQPMKADQMALQMAQFGSVEQMQNVNNTIKQMAAQQQPFEQLALTGLIGKWVTVDKTRFSHMDGQVSVMGFDLPSDAKEVKLTVLTDTGEPVFTKDLGSMKKGQNEFGWDGIKDNRLAAKTGGYLFRVEAKDDKGTSIHVNPVTQAQVMGVSFEGQDAAVLVGDAKHAEKVLMKNITKIGLEQATVQNQGAAQMNVSSNAQPANKFLDVAASGIRVPGHGAGPEGNAAAPKMMADAREMRGAAAPQAPAAQSPVRSPVAPQPVVEEKGFPNGFKD